MYTTNIDSENTRPASSLGCYTTLDFFSFLKCQDLLSVSSIILLNFIIKFLFFQIQIGVSVRALHNHPLCCVAHFISLFKEYFIFILPFYFFSLSTAVPPCGGFEVLLNEYLPAKTGSILLGMKRACNLWLFIYYC